MTNGIPASKTSAAAVVAPSAPVEALKAVWDRWKQLAKAVGVVQTRLLMIALYFALVFPIGLLARLSGDPLHLKAPKGSNWTPHRHEDPGLDTIRRQF